MHVFTLRSSDTDLDRDETDLNTDEERDSSVYTESDSSSSDSFYSTDSSSDSEPSQRGRRDRAARSVRPRRSRSALPAIERTTSSFVRSTRFQKERSSSKRNAEKPSESQTAETNWTPSAPSPALRARILQLELGDTIATDAESVNSKEPVSPKLCEKITGSPKNGAVKNIAAKFTFEESQSNEDRLEFLGRSKARNFTVLKSP